MRLIDKIKLRMEEENIGVPEITKETSIPKERIYKWIYRDTDPPSHDDYQIMNNWAALKRIAVPVTGNTSSGLAPYYNDTNIINTINAIIKNRKNPTHTDQILIPGMEVQAYINVFSNSLYPTIKYGEIIGIKEIKKNAVMFGYPYVIKIQNEDVLLSYIEPGANEFHWTLRNENKTFKSRQYHTDTISKLFLIKTLISKISVS